METKQCSDCGEVKPLSQFSLNGNGNPYPRCKPCRAAYVRKCKKKSSTPPDHEVFIVQQLIDNGFMAQHGRDVKQFNHVDIVVFGCIRAEAKLFKPASLAWDNANAGWYAGNSKAQCRDGWKADIVIIVHEDVLHFFKPTHPAFYIHQKLRSKILYNPDSLRKSRTDNRKLERRDMELARENYQLLETMFRQWRISHTKPKVVQLPMFTEKKAS